MSSVLDAREQLYRVQQLMLGGGQVLVQVGLCMPGGCALYPWQRLFSEATRQVKAIFTSNHIEVIEETCLYTAPGPYCLLSVRADARAVKAQMVELEEKAACGRLWDIDVVTLDGPIDRGMLGMGPRRCLVCNESAHVCRKLGTHPAGDVIAAARRIINPGR